MDSHLKAFAPAISLLGLSPTMYLQEIQYQYEQEGQEVGHTLCQRENGTRGIQIYQLQVPLPWLR
jgi:hypothetical protein